MSDRSSGESVGLSFSLIFRFRLDKSCSRRDSVEVASMLSCFSRESSSVVRSF